MATSTEDKNFITRVKNAAKSIASDMRKAYHGKPAELQLGNIVMDTISGFTGTITRRHDASAGYSQYAVTPRSENPSVLPEPQYFDAHQLMLLDKGIADKLPPHHLPEGFAFGAVVKDKYSDFSGVITSFYYDLNGCISASISSPKMNKDGLVRGDVLNLNSVELVKAPKPEPPQLRTGPAPTRGRSHPQASR